MESVSTPRISATMLDAYVGHNVIVVGKVMQLRGDSAVLDASGQVNAILNRESHLMAGNGAQIIGRVNPDLSIKVYNAMDLGSDVDYQVAQSVVEATHQYKELFVFDNTGATLLQFHPPRARARHRRRQDASIALAQEIW
ncbi:replication factor A protein 3 [Xylaria nigripes]|nr:replication factor A protein 3 [Xylaria nigripes]